MSPYCLLLIFLSELLDAVQGQSLPTITSLANETTLPLPTATTPPLLPPPTTNNSLFQCWTSWNLNAVEWAWADRHRTPVTIPYTTSISASLSYPSTASFTTLCDGIPRANPPVPTSTVYSTITDFNATQTLNLMPPLSNPSVDCNFCDRCPECNSISQFIAYSSSLWSAQPEPRTPSTLSLWLPCVAGTPTPFGPTTSVPFPTASNTRPAVPSCIIRPTIEGGTLYYWPMTTTNGDFCKQDGSTVTPAPTAGDGSPNTAVYDGMTLTSPTAVLVVESLWAFIKYQDRRPRLTNVGSVYTSATFSMHPTSLSSVDHAGNRLSAGSPLHSYSFNFADLNTVPYSAYSSAYCEHSNYEDCSHIWKRYVPSVGLPHEVTKLRSEWEFCTAWGSVRPVLVPVTAGAGGMSTSTGAARATGGVGGEKQEEDRVAEGEARPSGRW